MPRLERAQSVDLAVVGGLTLLALALRLPLMRDSLLGDELIMYGIVHDHGLGDVLSVVRDTEKTPPLHFALAWATARIGDPTWWVRLPSLVSGIALVPLGYALGLRTAGRAEGLVAAAILALQPYSMFYATEARAYALVALLAGLSTLCLLRALDTRSRWWWAAYALAVLGVAYTHYVGIFVLAAQAGWAFWVYRDRLRELVAVHALIVLAYIPWISSYLVQQGHSADEARRIAILAPPSVEYFGFANAQVAFGQPFASLRDVPGYAAAVLAVLLLAAALVAAGVRAWRRDPPGGTDGAGDPPRDGDAAGHRGPEPARRPQLPPAAQPDRVAAGARRPDRLAARVTPLPSCDRGDDGVPARARRGRGAGTRPRSPAVALPRRGARHRRMGAAGRSRHPGLLSPGQRLARHRTADQLRATPPAAPRGGRVRGRRVGARAPDRARLRGRAAARGVQARASPGAVRRPGAGVRAAPRTALHGARGHPGRRILAAGRSAGIVTRRAVPAIAAPLCGPPRRRSRSS